MADIIGLLREFILTYKEYFYHLVVLIIIFAILAQSFNLTFGLGRLFNLAHIASYSIGAYATALGSTEFNLGVFQCILLSILTSALFSISIGAISARLSNDYFAIGTMAFAALISALLINCQSITHGVLGISAIPRPIIFGFEFGENSHFLLLSLSIFIISQIILYLFFRNAFSRKLRAIGEFEIAAMSLGTDARLIKNFSLIIASAFAGLAGSLFAYYINYIDPSSFAFSESVFILSIVVIGRPGSFWTVLLASAFLVLLPEPLRYVDLSQWWSDWNANLGPMRQLLQASILFIVVFFQREKLFPVERKV